MDQDKINQIIDEMQCVFQDHVIARINDGALPFKTDAPFAVDAAGQYSFAPVGILWYFFQVGYAERAAIPVTIPKEANGLLIQHMPKGSGFRSGFEFCLKALTDAGVNVK